MIAEGHNFIFDGWWMIGFPGLAIMCWLTGFSLLADGLADLLRLKA